MTEKPPTSRKIGSVLARFQVFVDNVFEFGFKKLKAYGGKKRPPLEKPETLKGKAVGFAHKSASFIGDVGSAYYEKYQKLKAVKEKKSGEK